MTILVLPARGLKHGKLVGYNISLLAIAREAPLPGGAWYDRVTLIGRRRWNWCAFGRTNILMSIGQKARPGERASAEYASPWRLGAPEAFVDLRPMIDSL